MLGLTLARRGRPRCATRSRARWRHDSLEGDREIDILVHTVERGEASVNEVQDLIVGQRQVLGRRMVREVNESGFQVDRQVQRGRAQSVPIRLSAVADVHDRPRDRPRSAASVRSAPRWSPATSPDGTWVPSAAGASKTPWSLGTAAALWASLHDSRRPAGGDGPLPALAAHGHGFGDLPRLPGDGLAVRVLPAPLRHHLHVAAGRHRRHRRLWR